MQLAETRPVKKVLWLWKKPTSPIRSCIGGILLVADGTERSACALGHGFRNHGHETPGTCRGKNVFKGMGTYAPAFGMIGTLIGLVRMLQNLDDPSSIGPAMAVALLTTFYGAVLANVVFLPIANKLGGALPRRN